jgi:hypothetical protein
MDAAQPPPLGLQQKVEPPSGLRLQVVLQQSVGIATRRRTDCRSSPADVPVHAASHDAADRLPGAAGSSGDDRARPRAGTLLAFGDSRD